jgi:hypothetical protein
MPNPAFEFRPSGLIEFETVDAGAVAQQLREPAAEGLDTDPVSINYGRRKDCRPTAAERALAGTTIDWLVALPAEARPKVLCERFPHLANRLAREWLQTARSVQQLRLLAEDARWGSTGFPALVQGELQRLLRHLTAAAPRH